jgi:hypothetical protein
MEWRLKVIESLAKVMGKCLKVIESLAKVMGKIPEVI